MSTFTNVAFLFLILHLFISGRPTIATWCVARNDVSEDALQKALDFACGSGADCGPIQESGPCFLPNTVQAHASYAFNSYYMHAILVTTACDFDGTGIIAKTDPSYGSCVYLASPSNEGGVGTPRTPTVGTNAPPAPPNGTPQDGSGGAVNPPTGMNGAPLNGSEGALTPADMVNNPSSASQALSGFTISRLLFMRMMFVAFFFMFQPTDLVLA